MLTKQDICETKRVQTRLLKKNELSLYLDHLQRLDLKSRDQRFDHAICDNALISHCHSLSKYGTRIVGAFVDGNMRGACEISKPLYNRYLVRELAFSVETDCQGLGIGSKLMVKSLRLVKPATIKMYCQISNLGMIALAEKFEANVSVKRDYIVCQIKTKASKKLSKPTYANQFELMSLRDLLTMNPNF